MARSPLPPTARPSSPALPSGALGQRPGPLMRQALDRPQRPHCLPGKRVALPAHGPSQAATHGLHAGPGHTSPPGRSHEAMPSRPWGHWAPKHTRAGLGGSRSPGRPRSPGSHGPGRPQPLRSHRPTWDPHPRPAPRALTSFVQPALLHDGHVVHGAGAPTGLRGPDLAHTPLAGSSQSPAGCQQPLEEAEGSVRLCWAWGHSSDLEVSPGGP